MLKAVLFDLDQTLLNRDATFVAFARDQHRRFSRFMPGVSEAQYVAALRKFDFNGYSKKEVMFAEACDLLGIPSEARQLLEDFKANYGTGPVPFDDSLPTLESLRGRYLIGLVTNGRTLAQNAKITHSGLRPFFQDIRISESEGLKKPDPRIFHRCLDALGLRPAEAVYVGDHSQNDVAAAINAGLRGIWKRNPHYGAPDPCDAVIDRIAELPALLESMRRRTPAASATRPQGPAL